MEINSTNNFDIDFFRQLPRKCETLLIGIDGGGGSGKSTFAKKIRENISQTQIVQMDDFYDGSHIIWQRVEAEVLVPLSRNEKAQFRVYNWHSEKLGEWREIVTGGIVIIEGILSLKPQLAQYYDYKIWVACPRDIRLQRGIERDGEKWRDTWVNQWMPREDHYILHESPDTRADLILSGSD